MVCKLGYEGPMCAVCSEGYFQSMRSCTRCEKAKIEALVGALVGVIVGGLLLMASAAWVVQRYMHSLVMAHAFAHLKVVVSFITVAVTLDTQFGVIWPESFARALDAISLLSFDFGALSGVFCLIEVGFYGSLLCSTLGLVLVFVLMLGIAYAANKASIRDTMQSKWAIGAVYLLLFAYPVVAVKVVRAFACHDIDGVRYLRADYSIRCDTALWGFYAFYASVWVVCYVVALPFFVLSYLFAHRTNPNHLLAFLTDDYQLALPMLLWEGVEMIRKLLLSVIGSFWSTKSTICIATALLISASFLAVHLSFSPFKSPALNRMQSLALISLTLFYFVGLLLKTESIESGDQEDLGTLMAALMLSIFVAVVAVIVMEVHLVVQWAIPVWHTFGILFEGRILKEEGIPCVASFPGKYEKEWNSVTKLSSNSLAKRSAACVFLPMHAPRFGKHTIDDERVDGECFCYTLYGKQKAWGCSWFTEWRTNLLIAHKSESRSFKFSTSRDRCVFLFSSTGGCFVSPT
jgi:hypothetical protein